MQELQMVWSSGKSLADNWPRDSRQNFTQSVDKLQALYQNAPDEEEEELENDFASGFEEDDDGEENYSPEELRRQLAVLQERLGKMSQSTMNNLQRRSLKKLVQTPQEGKA